MQARHAEKSHEESYELLSPLETAEVKIRERAVTDTAEATNNRHWSCNLCPKHLNDNDNYQYVLQHLKETRVSLLPADYSY